MEAGAPVWEVVGGADKGGIIVRVGHDLASALAPSRLSTGAQVSEQQLVGDRLHYSLLTGTGPPAGWVSVRLKDKELLVKTAKTSTDFAPPKAPAAAPKPAKPPELNGAQELGKAAQGAAAPATPVQDGYPTRGGALPKSIAAPAAGRGPPGKKYADLSDTELRKACKEYGFYPGSLEEKAHAAALLEQIESVDALNGAELKHQIRTRGWATPSGMIKEDMVQRLREILVWERLRVGELRRVCRENNLPAQDVPQAREELLQLLADATWQARGIPVWRMPSFILAFGVLDQVDALESKDVEELWAMCEKRGLPVEDEPEQEILMDRVRMVVVWEHLPLEELRKECDAVGVLTGDMEESRLPPERGGAGQGYMWGSAFSAERDEKKELVRRLVEQLSQAPRAGGRLFEDPKAYAKRMAGYWEVLQLAPDAGMEELKRAYKELARKLHPDKNPGAEDRVTAEFQLVSEAYEALAEHLREHGYGY